jgi:hypothetical protein
MPRACENLAYQVGALPAVGVALAGPGLPLSGCWFHFVREAAYGVGQAPVYSSRFATSSGSTSSAGWKPKIRPTNASTASSERCRLSLRRKPWPSPSNGR